jgi:hypothetical protein
MHLSSAGNAGAHSGIIGNCGNYAVGLDARTIAMIPARIVSVRVGQASITSVKSGHVRQVSVGKCGATPPTSSRKSLSSLCLRDVRGGLENRF